MDNKSKIKCPICNTEDVLVCEGLFTCNNKNCSIYPNSYTKKSWNKLKGSEKKKL